MSHLTRAALILGKHATDTALKTNILRVARTLRTHMKTYIQKRLQHASKPLTCDVILTFLQLYHTVNILIYFNVSTI